MKYFHTETPDGKYVVLPLAVGGAVRPKADVIDAYLAGELRAVGTYSDEEVARARVEKLNSKGG